MSQSDYIKHKKASSILKTNSLVNDLEAVLSPSDYTQFKQYAIINSVKNTTPTYNQLLGENKHKLFNIEKNVSHCPTNFILCNQTHNRFNKKSNTQNLLFRGYKQYIPTHEFHLKSKLKRKYQHAKELDDYPELKTCEDLNKCNEFYFLRDQRSYDSDEDVVVFIG